MAINLGDIVWGLGPDTSRLRKALKDILDFGDAVETAAATAVSAGDKTAEAFRKQEAAIVSATTKYAAFAQRLAQAGAPPYLLKQSQDAVKEFTNEMTKGALSPLEFQRAQEYMNTSLARGQRALKDYVVASKAGSAATSVWVDTLQQFARASQFVTGPLAGLSYRLTVLSELISDNTLRLAFMIAAVAGVGYAFYKLSESTLKVEEGLLRTRMQLFALSGNMTMMQTDMKYTLDIANQFGEPFENIASHFAKIELASRGTTLEGAKVRDMFRDIISYSANMAQTQGQLSSQLNHVTEMLSRQQLSWRDVRGFLTSEYPNAISIMAAATNRTVADMERAFRRGDIVASEFLPKFFQQLNKAYGFDSSKMLDNLFSSQGRLANSWIVLNNAINQSLGLTDSYKATLDLLSKSFNFLAQNIDTVLRSIVTITGAILGGLLAPRVISGFVALGTAIVTVTRALVSFNIAAAVAALFTNPAAWIALIGVLGGAATAYFLFDKMVNTNKQNLLDTLPTIDAYIQAHEKVGKAASSTTKEMLAQAQAALTLAQANATAAASGAAGTVGVVVGPGSKGGEAAARSWWDSFLHYFEQITSQNAPEEGMTTILKTVSVEAAKKAAEASAEVLRIQAQIDKLRKILADDINREKNQKNDAQAETDRQRAMRLASEEMQRFTAESDKQFAAMQRGPKALADALEQIQLEKTIEGWRDKLQRAGFTSAEVKVKMDELTKSITRLKDAQLFDKQFMSLGQFTAESFDKLTTGALGKFIDAMNAGELATLKWKDLTIQAIGEIEKKILTLTVLNPIINSLFGTNLQQFSFSSGGTGTGGLFGQLLGKLGLQGSSTNTSMLGTPDGLVQGYQIQHGGSGTSRWGYYNPGIFMGAPRLHTGLAPDEFPAVLQKGETVIPKGGHQGGGNNVSIVVTHPPGTEAQTKQSKVGGTDLYEISIAHTQQGMGAGKFDNVMASRFGIRPRTTLR